MISPYVFVGLPNVTDPEQILEIVASFFNTTSKLVKSDSREKHIKRARHCYCFIMRRLYKKTLQYIGDTVNRDHSTVIHSIKATYKLANSSDKEYKNLVSLCECLDLTFKHRLSIMFANRINMDKPIEPKVKPMLRQVKHIKTALPRVNYSGAF